MPRAIQDFKDIPHEVLPEGTLYIYTNVPKEFFISRRKGDITPMMFDILCWIWSECGYNTGIAERCSAGTILQELFPQKKGRPHLSTIQRALNLCQSCGYITLPKDYRKYENYSIIAHSFAVKCEEGKILLWPKTRVSYRGLVFGVGVDLSGTNAEASAETSAEARIPIKPETTITCRDTPTTCAEASAETSVGLERKQCGSNAESLSFLPSLPGVSVDRRREGASGSQDSSLGACGSNPSLEPSQIPVPSILPAPEIEAELISDFPDDSNSPVSIEAEALSGKEDTHRSNDPPEGRAPIPHSAAPLPMNLPVKAATALWHRIGKLPRFGTPAIKTKWATLMGSLISDLGAALVFGTLKFLKTDESGFFVNLLLKSSDPAETYVKWLRQNNANGLRDKFERSLIQQHFAAVTGSGSGAANAPDREPLWDKPELVRQAISDKKIAGAYVLKHLKEYEQNPNWDNWKKELEWRGVVL